MHMRNSIVMVGLIAGALSMVGCSQQAVLTSVDMQAQAVTAADKAIVASAEAKVITPASAAKALAYTGIVVTATNVANADIQSGNYSGASTAYAEAAAAWANFINILNAPATQPATQP